MKKFVGLSVAAFILATAPASAKMADLQAFKVAYPGATALAKCNVCHTTTPALNPYGHEYGSKGKNFKALESLDSDGDGVSNVDEINRGTNPGVKN